MIRFYREEIGGRRLPATAAELESSHLGRRLAALRAEARAESAIADVPAGPGPPPPGRPARPSAREVLDRTRRARRCPDRTTKPCGCAKVECRRFGVVPSTRCLECPFLPGG